MERLSNKSPCLSCCADRQIGNPYSWQRDCEMCEKLENWKAAEANRLSAIEDILGEEYDIDRLRELVEADKAGRCVVLPFGGFADKDGENALKSAMNTCFYHNNPVTRYIADAVAEKLAREEAEAALEKMKEANL